MGARAAAASSMPRTDPNQRVPGSLRGARRHRRGSVERPVNGRLYRSAFLLVTLPLLLAALTVVQPAPLQRPILPPAFDATTAQDLATQLATRHPLRAPGTPGSARAATWFREQLRTYRLPTRVDTWSEDVPGLGRVRLRNISATVPGQVVQLAVQEGDAVKKGQFLLQLDSVNFRAGARSSEFSMQALLKDLDSARFNAEQESTAAARGVRIWSGCPVTVSVPLFGVTT